MGSFRTGIERLREVAVGTREAMRGESEEVAEGGSERLSERLPRARPVGWRVWLKRGGRR
jgi:hypothetical protein